MSRILVTGGAGYVGSHVCRALESYGFSPVVLDNLSTGFRENINPKWPFFQIDLTSLDDVQKLFHVEHFDGVIHCAAKTSVPEAEKDPDLYTRNNVMGTLVLCRAITQAKIKTFIFSSTAAVYGNKDQLCVETDPPVPENWYGMTKARAEELVLELPIPKVIFRYFNVCGAGRDADGVLRGDRRPPGMLLSKAIECSLKHQVFTVNGKDYDTPDGTAVRDLIYIEDLAQAHVYALRELLNGSIQKEVINLGSGCGYSVKTLAHNVKSRYGLEIRYGMRRPGDVAVASANTHKARDLLGWAAHSTLLQMIESEYNWQSSLGQR